MIKGVMKTALLVKKEILYRLSYGRSIYNLRAIKITKSALRFQMNYGEVTPADKIQWLALTSPD
jgi:hypothetical protein